MIRTLSNIKLKAGTAESELWRIAEKNLHTKPKFFRILKKSLDARDKGNIFWLYSIAFSDEAESEERVPLAKVKADGMRTVVVGTGPGGLFCAVRLVDHGIRPIVLERGGSVEERVQSTQTFFTERKLDVNSNIQFGEGGAGTFSDGKLFTQTNDKRNKEVLETFVRFGAPEEILYLNKPHIGSDKLQGVVRAMRQYILAEGGKILFHTQLTDLCIEGGVLRGVQIKDLDTGKEETVETDEVVLACGHSARDTFEMLFRRGVAMEQKEFAMGVRIEHLQDKIGFAQYGKSFALLPPADYKLTSHAEDRAAFTFCMCPGGFVLPATSEQGAVVTNGMSNFAREGKNANSALIVQIKKQDFGSEHPLAGVALQRKAERAAFIAGGGTYAAPVQRVGDFLRDKISDRFGEVVPSYAAGTEFASMTDVLPKAVTDALKFAIPDMDRKLKGFACPDAVLTGVESRTSSPVRIRRGENLESVNVRNLYPCGEGCGYAGGITSAAADGLRIAEKITEKYL